MGFGKDGKGVIINEKRNQALGALAADAGIFIGTKLATLERYRMLKSMINCTVIALTGSEGAGLTLYLADGDLSLSEVEAAIEQNGVLGPNDDNKLLVERWTLLTGVFDEAPGPVKQIHDAHTNGPLCVAKPRWTFARTKSWNWVIYNHGATITTGATVKIMAKSFGVWVL